MVIGDGWIESGDDFIRRYCGRYGEGDLGSGVLKPEVVGDKGGGIRVSKRLRGFGRSGWGLMAFWRMANPGIQNDAREAEGRDREHGDEGLAGAIHGSVIIDKGDCRTQGKNRRRCGLE